MTQEQHQFKTNSLGHLVPVQDIKDIDLLRDDTVNQLILKAGFLQKTMAEFKEQALADINTFISISADQYNTKIGGKKGNMSLVSYDGKYKVLIAVNQGIQFDERLHIAKQLIDECIKEWTKDSNSHIQSLIEHAFQTDKEGQVNTGRIFSLMRLKIDDEKWLKAMDALRDSIQPNQSSQYLRFYERIGKTDQYKQIALDLAAL